MDQTDIVNLALTKIGADRVNSIDDPNKSAQVMKTIWNAVLENELRSNVWSFAKRRAVLPALSNAPEFEYAYAYQQPSDCLRLVKINDFYVDPNWNLGNFSFKPAYEIEGKKILIDVEAPLRIVYIARITNTGLFDSNFVQSLASRLAFEASYRLTNQSSLKDAMASEYAQTINDAISTNSIELPPDFPSDSSWMRSRL